jgi:putative ABC transport system substrate-binding protein
MSGHALIRFRRPIRGAAVLAFLVGVGLPLFAAEAQQARRPSRIGVLNDTLALNHPAVLGLKDGLRTLGLQEDRDVVFYIRLTTENMGNMHLAAATQVQDGVDLIFTSGESATRAAADATQKIPIVFTLVGDPVTAGIRKSWVHSRENLTGVSSLTTRLAPKRLEALKNVAPNLRRVWAIYPGGEGSSLAVAQEAEGAARQLKLEILSRPVWSSDDVDRVLDAVRPGDGLLVPDTTVMDIPARILEKSLASRLPAAFPATFWVEHGGLLSYGADYRAQGLQAARLVAKILRGAKPQDMPVESADKIDLAINLRTATSFGLKVPQKSLLRADRLQR